MNAHELRKIILDAIPQESIESRHTEREHRYGHDSTTIDSVTTKIGRVDKSYLKQWAVNRGVEFTLNALSGTEAGREVDVRAILEDSRHQHARELDAAARIGTATHSALEEYLDEWIRTGAQPDTTERFLRRGTYEDDVFGQNTHWPSCVAALRSAEKFFKEYGDRLEPVLSEFKVWEEKKEIAGTCDALFVYWETYKGREGDKTCQHQYEEDALNKDTRWCFKCGAEQKPKLVIADWKSSNSIQKDEYAWQIAAYKYALEKATGLKVDEAWVIRFSKEKQEFGIMRLTNTSAAIREFALISKLDAMIKKREREHGNLLAPLITNNVITL